MTYTTGETQVAPDNGTLHDSPPSQSMGYSEAELQLLAELASDDAEYAQIQALDAERNVRAEQYAATTPDDFRNMFRTFFGRTANVRYDDPNTGNSYVLPRSMVRDMNRIAIATDRAESREPKRRKRAHKAEERAVREQRRLARGEVDPTSKRIKLRPAPIPGLIEGAVPAMNVTPAGASNQNRERRSARHYLLAVLHLGSKALAAWEREAALSADLKHFFTS